MQTKVNADTCGCKCEQALRQITVHCRPEESGGQLPPPQHGLDSVVSTSAELCICTVDPLTVQVHHQSKDPPRRATVCRGWCTYAVCVFVGVFVCDSHA